MIHPIAETTAQMEKMMNAQTVIDRAEFRSVPDYGAKALAFGAARADLLACNAERFADLVAEVRAELRNEMIQAIGGERQFVPGYSIDCNGRKLERLVRVPEALMEALEHDRNPQVLLSMLSGRGSHVVNLLTLREGVIDAYSDLNAEAVAQARMERLS